MENLNEKKGMPLLGDGFPEMTVQTTRGVFNQTWKSTFLEGGHVMIAMHNNQKYE